MSRALKDFRLNDRASRQKLAPRAKPYWRLISDGCHLGYRSGKIGGSWIARFREPGSATDYKSARLGGADDRADADGDTVLNWAQALASATVWFGLQSAQNSRGAIVRSVGQAVEAYVSVQDTRATERAGKTTRSVASSRLQVHVLSDKTLPGIMLDRLGEHDLKRWLGGVTGIGASSKKRLCADLKAALNAAVGMDRSVLPGNLKLIISEGLKVYVPENEEETSAARENQILSDETVRALVACAFDADEDVGRMVLLLAATGARFSQLQRMTVRDVQIDQSRVMIPSSRKGRSRKVSHCRMPVGSDVIKALGPAVDGRAPEAVLLERWCYAPEHGICWTRHHRAGWGAAADITRAWTKIAKAAGVPNAIPYALRHSSIVRGLRNGLPIRLVAALHDTSVEMIERHYARWITEGLDDLVAGAIVPMLRAA